MNRGKMVAMTALATAVFVLGGCGNGGNSSNGSSPADSGSGKTAVKIDTSPVTLKVFNNVSMNDQDFATLLTDPVKKKYPNITLEVVKPGKGSNIADLVAAGDVPDILLEPDAGLTMFEDLGVLDDISPLVKQQNVDLSRFQPVMLDAAKTKGVLHGLPFARNFTALYYNKDIFDKFALSYPKDGMTWDETLNLAKKLSRTDGNISYHGLDPTNINLLSFPLATAYVDAKTEKASVNNDQWKTIFQLAKNIYSIPGNGLMDGGTGADSAATRFLKNKNVAMVTAVNILTFFANVSDVNWDLAQFPSYPQAPGVSDKVDAHLALISKNSKHKQQAMQVLSVLTSDEVQLKSVRSTLRVSPLANKQMQDQFGADLPYLKGKNVPSLFKGKVVAAPEYSPYNSQAQSIANKQFYEQYLTDKQDLNTVLKSTDDLVNQMLESQKK